MSQSAYAPLSNDCKDDLGILFDTGVTPKMHALLVNVVCTEVYKNLPHNSGADMSHIVASLSEIVKGVRGRYRIKDDRRFLTEWLMAEAICAYAISRFTYDTVQAQEGFSYLEQVRLGDPSLFLKATKPRAVCNGYARFVRDAALLAGLECRYVGGYFRQPRGETPKNAGHGWNLFTFSNGLRVPADTTRGYSGGDQAAWSRSPRKVGWSILPRTPRAMELFLSMYLQIDDVETRYGDSQVGQNLLSLSKTEWLNTSVRDYDRLFSSHYLAQDANAKVLGR